MSDLYLTIDDSPSGIFPEMCAFLKERNIPAVFFARGDLMSLYPERMVQAIKDGFVIANHSWSHHRASRLGAQNAAAEVLKTQELIDGFYRIAGVERPGPYLRFPYMDAGLGGWPLPIDALNEEAQKDIRGAYAGFYGNDMREPDEKAIKTFEAIQTELRAYGFKQLPFEGVTLSWFNQYEASGAVSTQGTFCHPDWIMNRRYEGRIPEEERSIEALNRNFDAYIKYYPDTAQILVLHDSVELWPVFKELADHALKQGHRFLPIPV